MNLTWERSNETVFGNDGSGHDVLPGAVSAQEVINLTVASSHPTVVPWVGMIKTHFMARTDEILAEKGDYKIEWNEAFGGTLYKANATLSVRWKRASPMWDGCFPSSRRQSCH
jgi:hypothetical protein